MKICALKVITKMGVSLTRLNIIKLKYSPVPNNRRGLNKRGGPTDNLNINKRGGPNKRGDLKNVP